MKKLISTLLIVTLLFTSLLTLSSCNLFGGGNNSADFVVPEGGYDGSAVTIRFYHTMGADLRKVLDDAIVRFNALYPNITIEHEQVGSYNDVRDRVKTEISVGDQPNIAYCYPDHVALYNVAKAAIKLDNLIASTIEIERFDGTTEVLGLTAEQIADFIPGYYAEGAQFDDEGTMYTLPMSKSTEVLFYNKSFFEGCQRIYNSDILIDLNGNPIYLADEDGNLILDADGNPQTQQNENKGNDLYNISVPTTWAEMEEVCRKIKIIDPTCIPLGYDSEANWFITMCEQYGSDYTSATGEHFIFDNQTNYDFVKTFRQWYQDGLVITQDLNQGNYSSKMFTAQSGVKCYMSIGSSAGAKNQRPTKVNNEYPFEVGCTIVPQLDPKNPKVISQGPSLCIFGKSNPQEVIASWLFVKFITTDTEFQAKFSMVSGYVPVIQSVADNDVYSKFTDKADGGEYLTALSAAQCLAQANAYYTSPAFNGSSTARDQVGLLLNACLSQKPEANESVEDMIKRLFKNAIDECEYQHPN
ncbi:MAG: extracellular solute-binding protein [Clostridia bacterium]|nr:extracellular solute-binding protein [Clostridia bacterium]